MKRFRKLVIGGIESKIVVLILVAMILVTAVFLAVTFAQSRMLAGLAEETSERQKSSITSTTTGVVTAVIDDSMSRGTELHAEVADEMFRDLVVIVRMMGEYAGKLFGDPGSVAPAAYQRPDAANEGVLSAQMIFAEGVEEAAISDRLGLIANMSDMMLSLCASFEIEGAYIGLPEGAMLSVNTAAGEWVRQDGSYVTFDPRERYWYQQAAEAGELIFTDVETDQATGEMCVTCAMPVIGADGELEAVVGADFFLTEIQQAVAESARNGGYLVVVNQNGHVILSPAEKGVFRVHNSSEAFDLRQSDNAKLSRLVQDALEGKTNMRLVRMDNNNFYMIGVPMKTAGWALISVYSEDSARQPVEQLRSDFEKTQEEATAIYREQSIRSQTIVLAVLIVLLAAMLCGALAAGRRIVKPLNTITERIANTSGENMEFKMEDAYRTGDEVEELAQSFADLSRKTVEYVEEVKRVTAEKERIGTELHMANQIQEGMLPSIFPPYPDRSEFDLYATMDPAKEVGGDFYDFFLIDGDHLALVMADVSGKGIPAALFMMVSKALLKNSAMMGKSPAEILSTVNDTICTNNKMQMFVTVWMGILEISTGKITAANAGHEYPAICQKGGAFTLYKDRHGFVVGGMEGVRYREYELTLSPGDRLFLYTDGVPEATDADEALFGTERMIAALNGALDGAPAEILAAVRKSVDAFVGGAEQFDDLTMLCLEYKGT
ncbi:MAG: SpoIIE family protein phosphatase [Clostridiales bacterium]|nr:SpoIIE family protein phosphatase [Clostridiales bacterium]